MYKFFQTIKVEHDKPVEGTVTGEIPSWIKGSLYRNGPGKFEFGDDKYNHWFDGMAMFQRFHISDKKVTYQSRFLQSDTYKKNMAAQRIVVGEFGTASTPDPCQNIFQRFLTRFISEDSTDNCLVNFFPLHDELYATTETQYIHRVDPETLDSLERVDLSKCVAINIATAHPHMDPDGTVHNLGHSFKGKPKVCIIKIPPKQELSEGFPAGEVVSAIESDYKFNINYFHSFAMTEHYYIYILQPLLFNYLTMVANKVAGRAFGSALQFYKNIKTRFQIIDRKTGNTVNSDLRYESNSFLYFHQINAYEDNGHIVVDVCAEKDGRSLESVYLKSLRSEEGDAEVLRKFGEPEPRRYVLPINVESATAAGKNLINLKYTTATAELRGDCNIFLTHEVLAETGFEFPQINYARVNGKRYKYAYGVAFHQNGPIFNTLCKIDVETKTFVEWREDKCYPSEPVFVANPDGTDEDDGVLLSAVNRTDFDTGKNAFFLILDAKSMKEIARAEFNVPRFPKDFHGLFRPV